MGLLTRLFESLFRPGMVKQAIRHWDAIKEARRCGDLHTARIELLKVVRACQEAIEADPQKEGDGYVLLINTLIAAPELFDAADKKRLVKYQAASIHSWFTLPYKRPPITKNCERGVQTYEKVLVDLKIAGYSNPVLAIGDYSAQYSQPVTSLSPGLEMISAAFYGVDDQSGILTHPKG